MAFWLEVSFYADEKGMIWELMYYASRHCVASHDVEKKDGQDCLLGI